MFDFSARLQFFRMVHAYIGQLDAQKKLRWISVAHTLFDRRYESQKQFFEVTGRASESRFSSGVLSLERRHQLRRSVHDAL